MRTLYIFDASRTAILLIGGDKTGNNRWYEQFVPAADRIYDEYLREVRPKDIGSERGRALELFRDGVEAVYRHIRQVEVIALRHLHSPEWAPATARPMNDIR